MLASFPGVRFLVHADATRPAPAAAGPRPAGSARPLSAERAGRLCPRGRGAAGPGRRRPRQPVRGRPARRRAGPGCRPEQPRDRARRRRGPGRSARPDAQRGLADVVLDPVASPPASASPRPGPGRGASGGSARCWRPTRRRGSPPTARSPTRRSPTGCRPDGPPSAADRRPRLGQPPADPRLRPGARSESTSAAPAAEQPEPGDRRSAHGTHPSEAAVTGREAGARPARSKDRDDGHSLRSAPDAGDDSTLPGVIGTSAAMPRGRPDDPPGRPVARLRPDRRRDRHGQGADRPRHPRPQPALRPARTSASTAAP